MLFILQVSILSEQMIFLNIKIIRVIIPLTTILHGYRDSEEFIREQRLYRPNRKNLLNRGLCPQHPLLGGGLRPTPTFSNITFLN